MSRESGDGLPTGEQPGVPNDVADPHPSTEEFGDSDASGAVTKPGKDKDIGQNSYAHDGNSPPRPKHSNSGQQ